MDAQALRSAIKSSRDLMRQDAGLNTDVDRIPQLSWMLFLKCFDDFEKKRSALDKNYKMAIPEGYQWSDWAANKKFTGKDLIKFVNDELFPKLAELVGGKGYEQRDVISSIFRDLNNRVVSGYVLRQIIDLVDTIDFVNTDDVHTMAKIYEDLLFEMRNAAGSHGEFYTPRPVIRFIVEQIKPSLKKSEKILDPACGTGGFLIESLEFMKKDEESKAAYEKLRYHTLYGTDKKPLPFLLCMMNMLLHEIDKPNVARTNPLQMPFREITERDQVDIIMTNPPFGGTEEDGTSANFPVGFRTSDTAIAFLLYCILKLKDGKRCAIILPDGGILSSGGIPKKLREKLLTECNLHTIVRMHKSVFKPYAGIGTNILFFTKGKPTKEIWCYKMKLREGIKAYGKTKPIQFADFKDVVEWCNNQKENENAWKVKVEDLKDFDLDLRNPNEKYETINYSPHELIEKILKDEEKTVQLLQEIKQLIDSEIPK